MSPCVRELRVVEITSKIELAQRMSADTKVPEDALKAVFKGAMLQLESFTHAKFESPMEERVWEAISGQRLEGIRETFMLEFCEQILGSFSEEQAAEMLQEHERVGAVKNTTYSKQIQVAYALSQRSITDAVVKKALSMSKELVDDLVTALRREGIELPTPKTT